MSRGPAGYEAKTADPYSSHVRLARLLDAYLAHRPAPRVLDVGCAAGLIKTTAGALKLPVAARATWTGLDGDPAAVAAAAATGMTVHRVDLATDPLPEFGDGFDAIVLGDVLEHVPSPATTLRHLLDAAARPDTVVLVSLPNVAHVSVRLQLLSGRFTYAGCGILDGTHLRFFTRSTALALLRDAGLRVTDVVATPVPLHLALPALPRLVLKPLHALSYGLTRAWPTLFAYQFVIVAQVAAE
jgi:2-polyprenyl-3-methyl-5-hydroxy-6-metoxy-1,4-benzoquinol methylase